MLDYLALDDGADHVAQAGILLKRVLAGLELGPRFQRNDAADESPAIVVDHAFTLQDIGDIGHAGARGNIDDLVFLQRAPGFDLLLAVDVHRTGAEQQGQHDGDDGIADDDERVAGALRPLRRRRDLFGLQRGARTPW